MLGSRESIARLLCLFVLGTPLVTAHAIDQSSTPAQTTHHRKAHKKPTPVVLPPMPSGPLRQLPMDQIPAAPPKVAYQNGLLSISAQNATLGEILREVRKQTGAAIDIPQSGANERVVTQLGPGAPRDVLAALLNGTSFNYVMVGSPSDPSTVASVMLSARPSAGGEVQTVANIQENTFPPPQQPGGVMPGRVFPPQPFRAQLPQPGMNQPPPQGAAAADADDNADDADADDKDDEADQAQPGQPGQAIVQPDANGIVTQPEPGDQPNSGPKTPDQILQLMRQQQQQQGAMPPTGPPSGPPPQQQ
jgi:hypothetical protein